MASPGWHFLFAVNWGMFECRFQTILSNLGRHSDTVDRDAAAMHFQQMKDMRERSRQELVEFEKRRESEMVQKILQWLSGDEDNQEDVFGERAALRQPGTCDWILTKPNFTAWMSEQGSPPFIWIKGKPGSGRSHHIFSDDLQMFMLIPSQASRYCVRSLSTTFKRFPGLRLRIISATTVWKDGTPWATSSELYLFKFCANTMT